MVDGPTFPPDANPSASACRKAIEANFNALVADAVHVGLPSLLIARSLTSLAKELEREIEEYEALADMPTDRPPTR